MSIDVTWYVEGRLLYAKQRGVFDAEDLIELVETSNQMHQQVQNNRVHSIIDSRDVEKISISFSDIRQFDPTTSPNNMGWIVLVTGSNPLIMSFGNLISIMAAQIFKKHYRVFQNLEDALLFLQDQDSELESLL